jgi:aryl-alcohol dehydrogenase-like predicted oxidoreductase
MLKDEIIFGTASVGSRTSYQDFSKTALHATSKGIRVFDTSPIYGRGIAFNYINRFMKENPQIKIQIITKVGRTVKIDLKTLFIYFLRMNFSFFKTGLINIRGSEFNLSGSVIRKTNRLYSKLIEQGVVSDILIHSPEKVLINKATLNEIKENFDQKVSIGCSDPDYELIKYFEKYSDNIPLIQVGYQDFIQTSYYQKYTGTVVINGLLRHSFKTSDKLCDIFVNIKNIRGKLPTKFNFGFHTVETVNLVIESYNSYKKFK